LWLILIDKFWSIHPPTFAAETAERGLDGRISETLAQRFVVQQPQTAAAIASDCRAEQVCHLRRRGPLPELASELATHAQPAAMASISAIPNLHTAKER
jgi:hypothetical protein